MNISSRIKILLDEDSKNRLTKYTNNLVFILSKVDAMFVERKIAILY